MSERHRRADYRRGRDANLGGRQRDEKQNVDWLAGWDDAQSDRRLDGECFDCGSGPCHMNCGPALKHTT